MKKILCLALSLLTVISLTPVTQAFAEDSDEYISTPIEISESDCNKQSMVGFGEQVKANYSCLSYHGTNTHPYLLIDINDVKNNEKLTWKEEWTDGKTVNTATYNGIDYKMIVKSAANGGKAGIRMENSDKEFDVTDGHYTGIKILANSLNGVGSNLWNLSLNTGIVLNYSDGTQEYKETGVVYDPFNRSDNCIAFKTIRMNGSLWSEATRTAGNENDSTPAYMHILEIPVNYEKELVSIKVLSEKTKAVQSGNSVTLSTVANSHSGTAIFAMTAVVSKNVLSDKLKSELENVILANKGNDISTDSGFYSSVKAIADKAVANGIDTDKLFSGYTPKIISGHISGEYEAESTLTASFQTSDPFGREVSLGEISWYKSAVITEDKSQYELLGTGESYTLKDSDIGSYIYALASPLCEDVKGLSMIISEGGEKISDVFFKIVAPTAENVYFKGKREVESAYPDEEIFVKYNYSDLNGDAEEGTVFTFEKASFSDGEFNIVQSSTENKYKISTDDLNSYIRCRVLVKNNAEKGDEAKEVISENLIYVQGDKNSYGTKLIGNYEENADILVLSDSDIADGFTDFSVYEWYTTDDITKKFPENWEKIEKNSQIFKLNAEIFGKYIAVKITPAVSDESGNTTASDSVIKYFYKPSAPIAYSVSISSDNKDLKTVKSGDTLTGSYVYIDPNGDKESGSEIRWEKSVDGENWTELSKSVNTYKLTDSDTDCYIRFSVIPKSEGQTEESKTAVSESFLTPFAPVATDLKISGTAIVGNTLTAEYKFTDKNGNADIDSEIIWYSVSGTKTELGRGVNYVLKSSDAGKTVAFELTPKTNVEPVSGETVISGSVTVSKKSGGSSGSSSSSSSSKSSYKGTAVSGGDALEYVQDIPEVEFYDIDGHWAEASILAMNEKGYMTGFEKKFRPDDNISRAELGAVMARALDLKGEFSPCFSDISEDKWYAEYICALYNIGIVSGDGGRFRPDEPVTREQAAKMFSEAYKYKKNLNRVDEGDTETFSDYSDISEWACGYVGEVYSLGLMKGDDAGKFKPQSALTRAEACVIIERFLGL